MSDDFAQGGGALIGLNDLELLIKIGPGRELLDKILLSKIAAATAQQRSVTVSDEEAEVALAELYAELDLFEPPQIERWLSVMKLDEPAMKAYARENLLKEKLRTVLVSDEAVQQRFLSSPYDYTMLHLQRIAFATRSAASETVLQLNEAEITWEQAAERAGGMDSLVLRRKDAAPEAAVELFISPLGGYVGPVEDAEDDYLIYRVAWKVEPELDDALREEIRSEMFEEELRAPMAEQPLEFLR